MIATSSTWLRIKTLLLESSKVRMSITAEGLALTATSDLQTQYTNFKNALQSLAQKVGEIEQEIEEHKLVTETLQPLPGDRKCFRLINGVLVERTVKDILPALKTNSDGLKQVLDELVKQYKGKQDEMDKWKASSCGPVLIQLLTDCCTEEEQYSGRSELIRVWHPISYPSRRTGLRLSCVVPSSISYSDCSMPSDAVSRSSEQVQTCSISESEGRTTGALKLKPQSWKRVHGLSTSGTWVPMSRAHAR